MGETATNGNYAADIGSAFQKKFVEYFKEKLEDNEKVTQNPTVGRNTALAFEVAVVFSSVVAIAIVVATAVVKVLPVAAAVPFGLVGPLVMLVRFVHFVVGRHKSNRKRKCKIIIDAIVEKTGKELSRIYKYQLSMLKDTKAAEIMARSAVNLMINLKEDVSFDCSTLLRKMRDPEGSKGVIEKQELETKPGVTSGTKKWHTPSVFWKPESRKVVLSYDDQRDVKINKKYGFRGEFDGEDDGAANTENGENLRLMTATAKSTQIIHWKRSRQTRK